MLDKEFWIKNEIDNDEIEFMLTSKHYANAKSSKPLSQDFPISTSARNPLTRKYLIIRAFLWAFIAFFISSIISIIVSDYSPVILIVLIFSLIVLCILFVIRAIGLYMPSNAQWLSQKELKSIREKVVSFGLALSAIMLVIGCCLWKTWWIAFFLSNAFVMTIQTFLFKSVLLNDINLLKKYRIVKLDKESFKSVSFKDIVPQNVEFKTIKDFLKVLIVYDKFKNECKQFELPFGFVGIKGNVLRVSTNERFDLFVDKCSISLKDSSVGEIVNCTFKSSDSYTLLMPKDICNEIIGFFNEYKKKIIKAIPSMIECNEVACLGEYLGDSVLVVEHLNEMEFDRFLSVSLDAVSFEQAKDAVVKALNKYITIKNKDDKIIRNAQEYVIKNGLVSKYKKVVNNLIQMLGNRYFHSIDGVEGLKLSVSIFFPKISKYLDASEDYENWVEYDVEEYSQNYYELFIEQELLPDNVESMLQAYMVAKACVISHFADKARKQFSLKSKETFFEDYMSNNFVVKESSENLLLLSFYIKNEISPDEPLKKIYNKYLSKVKSDKKTTKKNAIKTKLLGEAHLTAKKVTIDDVDLMNGGEFEEFISRLFHSIGYETSVTKASGDQGVDVILEKDGMTIGVQCKRYSGKISNKAVQEAVAGKAYYKLDKVMVVTNSVFTSSAEELASANDVILWDRNVLIDKIKKVR